MTAIQGLHHVTAITNDARKNIAFYTGTLGLRLVKLTINYDDPSTYHLYYGDGVGSPGTIMTFFAWAGRRGSVGTGLTSETAFAVPEGALGYWRHRLGSGGEAVERFGQRGITFKDVDGMDLALFEVAGAPAEKAWLGGGAGGVGGVPMEAAIRGFHGVTLNETDARLPASVLVDRFGYRQAGAEGLRTRYEAEGNVGRYVDVIGPQARVPAHGGTGTVHHVAFRVPDDAAQAAWQKQLLEAGLHVSPVMDRDYFHSIYFREPGGVLFELATDGPGMTINEPAETLGTKLVLPKWLEGQRAAVEAGLPALA